MSVIFSGWTGKLVWMGGRTLSYPCLCALSEPWEATDALWRAWGGLLTHSDVRECECWVFNSRPMIPMDNTWVFVKLTGSRHFSPQGGQVRITKELLRKMMMLNEPCDVPHTSSPWDRRAKFVRTPLMRRSLPALLGWNNVPHLMPLPSCELSGHPHAQAV